MAAQRNAVRRRRAWIALALGIGGLLVVALVQPLWAFSILGNALPGVLWRVETSEPLVALSFDDGPDPTFTPQVLDLLERHGAHATFFLIAERALPRPDLVARIRAEGHEVASHYTTRRAAWRDSNQQFADNLAFAGKILDLPATRPRLFRPPGGIARPDQLERARHEGYTIVLGSAYPYDGAPPPTAYIRWLVTKNLAPGVIVILHDGIEDPSRAIRALPSILDAGAARGLRFVTVGELIRSRKPGNG
jgi:peptidoglycan-N-acetylglucosamine deacetylase